jgi:hypothetical protein
LSERHYLSVDVIFEWLIQVVLEVVGWLLAEVAFDAVSSELATALTRRLGRWVLGAIAGLGFGIFWGHHLSGQASYPRLLWVSLALGGFAALFAVGASNPDEGERVAAGRRWRELLAPPWEWHRDRFLGLVFINAGLALGITVTFHAAS